MNSLNPGIYDLASAALLTFLLLQVTGCATPDRIERRPEYPLPVLSRAQWQAAEPVAPMQPHRLNRITVHHTATRQNPGRSLADKLRALQQFSQNESQLASGGTKPPWPDVPYHFYIDVQGAVAEGRELRFAGDTNTDYDPAGHILIVLEGSFEEEHPTEGQMQSLRTLTRWLAREHRVPPDRIGGHKDFARTACPGINLQSKLQNLRENLAGDE